MSWKGHFFSHLMKMGAIRNYSYQQNQSNKMILYRLDHISITHFVFLLSSHSGWENIRTPPGARNTDEPLPFISLAIPDWMSIRILPYS